MERTILFRGKVSTSGPNHTKGDWIYGFLASPFSIYVPHKDPAIEGHYFIESKTVGQWTGLTDSDGVDIYEGDICEVQYFVNIELNKFKGLIEFKYGCMLATKLKYSATFQPLVHTHKMYLLGNKWDQPELLGKPE